LTSPLPLTAVIDTYPGYSAKLSTCAFAPSAARALAITRAKFAVRNREALSLALIELGSTESPPDDPLLEKLEPLPEEPDTDAEVGVVWMLLATVFDTATAPITAAAHTSRAITRRMRRPL
jgi:hypothetical protein